MNRIRAGVARAYLSISLQRCLVPDCESNKVIKAHSIQEKRVLEQVAVEGHVYMFQGMKQRGLVRVGIHTATRFTGFCAEHDNMLFDAVDIGEHKSLDFQNPEHVARLSLRAVAREYWNKLNSQKLFRMLMEMSANSAVQDISQFLNVTPDDAEQSLEYTRFVSLARLRGSDVAVERIGRQFHSLLYQLEIGKFHLSKFRTLSINAPLRIAAASHFPPEFDLRGNRQVLKHPGVDLAEVTLNIVPDGARTAVLFMWHKRFDPLLKPFIATVEDLPLSKKTLVLSQMLLMQCENMALSPKTVESWNESERAAVEGLFAKTLDESIPYDRAWAIDLFGASC